MSNSVKRSQIGSCEDVDSHDGAKQLFVAQVARPATSRPARGALGWSLPKEAQYWVVLPIIALWGVVGLIILLLGL